MSALPIDRDDGSRLLVPIQAGEVSCALPLDSTHCVLRLGAITEVPCGPAHVAGLTSHRGEIITVIGLMRQLAGGPLAVGCGMLAVVIRHEGEPFALVVDHVGDVVAVGPGQRVAGSAIPPGLPTRAVESVYVVDGAHLAVLDVAALLSGS